MKRFLKYLRPNPYKNSASVAKERLKIIVAHQRTECSSSDFLPKLRQELVAVIARYVDIDLEQVKVGLEQEGNSTILELNITIPKKSGAAVA